MLRVEIFYNFRRLEHLHVHARPNALPCVVIFTVRVSPQSVAEKGSFLVLTPFPQPLPLSEELSGKDWRARGLLRPSSIITDVPHAASVRILKHRRSTWGHPIPYLPCITISGVSQQLLPAAL